MRESIQPPRQGGLKSCAKADREKQAFERLKTHLQQAFAAPESTYQRLTAADIIARNPLAD